MTVRSRYEEVPSATLFGGWVTIYETYKPYAFGRKAVEYSLHLDGHEMVNRTNIDRDQTSERVRCAVQRQAALCLLRGENKSRNQVERARLIYANIRNLLDGKNCTPISYKKYPNWNERIISFFF